MTQKEKVDTRNVIINCACRLFSKYGFEGTSIRDIATECGVNVASVNYHFKNKEGLYWEIFIDSHEHLEKGFQEAAQKAKNLDELVIQVFQMLLQDKSYIRNSIRLMLADSITVPEDDEELMQRLCSGPPGQHSIAEFLQKECDTTLTSEQIMWGVKVLLGSLIHWAMMCSMSKFELMQASNPMFAEDHIQKDLRHTARSVINYLKSGQI